MTKTSTSLRESCQYVDFLCRMEGRHLHLVAIGLADLALVSHVVCCVLVRCNEAVEEREEEVELSYCDRD